MAENSSSKYDAALYWNTTDRMPFGAAGLSHATVRGHLFYLLVDLSVWLDDEGLKH